MSGYKHLSIDEFYKGDFKNLKKGDLILDVRTPEEFEESHITGSKNINHTDVASKVNELEGYERIFILCKRGARAQAALNALAAVKPNFNWVCISDGGMEKWIDSNYPVE